MKKLKIESGIPIEQGSMVADRAKHMRQTLCAMKVGDSVELENTKVYNSLKGYERALRDENKLPKKAKFTARTLDKVTGKKRIWRVS